jgi:hypothetical protein
MAIAELSRPMSPEEQARHEARKTQERTVNNARHKTMRMKTPKDTCAFMPCCNARSQPWQVAGGSTMRVLLSVGPILR